MTFPELLSMATTEGWLRTMPSPFMYIRVLAVPRSIARCVENIPNKFLKKPIPLPPYSMNFRIFFSSILSKSSQRSGESSGKLTVPSSTTPAPAESPCSARLLPTAW